MHVPRILPPTQTTQHLLSHLNQTRSKFNCPPLESSSERNILRTLALSQGELLCDKNSELYVLPSEVIPTEHVSTAPIVYLFKNTEDLLQWLEPYSSQLSTIGWGLAQDPPAHAAPRLTPLGTMQTPSFPRLHDGIEMWTSLVYTRA